MCGSQRAGSSHAAWSPFEFDEASSENVINADHVIVSWDNDSDREDGTIPLAVHSELVARLKRAMREEAEEDAEEAEEDELTL